MRRIAYPVVQRAAAEYVLHGKTISEPYIALEDPSSAECKQYVDEQNALFENYLSDRSETRKVLFQKISQLQDYPRHSTVGKRHDKFYFYYNSGLQNQSVYMRSNSITGHAPEVFLDPNTLSADGTTALKSASWNDSETQWAYSVSEKGSDWQTIYVRDAQRLKDLDDKIDWVKFSGIAWLKDVGFFYTRYPALAEGQEKGAETDTAQDAAVYFHRIGTPQSDDVFVVSEPEHRTWSLGAEVTDCNRHLIVTLHDGCETKNLMWVADLTEEGPVAGTPLKFEKIINEFVGDYSYLGNDGDNFYLSTTKNAPKKKIVNFNIRTLEETDIVPERASVLSFASLVKDTIIVAYLEDVKDVVYLLPLRNPTEQLKLPLPIGTVEAISCHRKKSLVSIKITSFLLPGRSYTFDITDPLTTLAVFKDDVSAGFDPDTFETKQVFYTSDDGTKIPMFILHRAGLTLDGTSPLLVYGYGGFNISLTPGFSPSRIVFLNDMNGVIAIPNIRGGGEYGQEWHDGGRRANKQNCFTDFIAAIKYLQGEGYGSPSTTAIMGGSNGGLLVAAVANQAPELLASVVCQVGVLDMYKFHKFTIGHAWRSDYGDPDVAEDFAVLEKYSPIHNVVAGTKYPAVVVVTGDHDDRVVPLHSHKYVATMQHANPELGGPFLSRIEVAAGHGAGKPTSKRIQEAADTYAFLVKSLNVKSFA
jgi:prolyl oligopeptidase